MNALRNARFSPRLECLEDRRLLTASFTFDDGLLTILGDAGRNVISINDNGVGGISLSLDGKINTLDGVEEILVRTKRGVDELTYNLNGPLDSDRTLDIDMGAGRDKVTATLWKDIRSGADITFDVRLGTGKDTFDATLGGNIEENGSVNFDRVDGGSGEDTIAVHATNDVDIEEGGQLNAFLEGGRFVSGINFFAQNEEDRIFFDYQGDLDGVLVVQAKGAIGQDEVSVELTLDSGSSGEVDNSLVNGNAGSDDLTFIVNKVNNKDDVIVQASISGGLGIDDSATYTAGFVNPDNTIEDDNAI